MKLQSKQVQLILLFSVLFVIIGWTAPMAYATYAPQEQFIEVHEFSADDAYKHSNSHQICFDRTIKNGNTGEIFIELYMKGENNNSRVEVDTNSFEDYFQKGKEKIVRPYPLPEEISAGTYRYELVITLNVANERVEREFKYNSNKFEIVNGKDVETLDRDFCN